VNGVAFGFMVHELEHFKDFSLASGMLSTVVNAAKSIQNCPKLPIFVKIRQRQLA
jgi:hypothetical protein